MNLPDNGKHYELWEGKLVEIMSPSGQHGRIAGLIITEINIYLKQNPLGLAYSNDTSFRLAPDTIVGPDVAFMAFARLKKISEEGAMPLAPDLAIEVISPSDNYGQVDAKIEKYLRAGTRLVWSVNPRRHKVTVYRQQNDEETILGIKDILDGEDVLPGFRLPLANIFKSPFPE